MFLTTAPIRAGADLTKRFDRTILSVAGDAFTVNGTLYGIHASSANHGYPTSLCLLHRYRPSAHHVVDAGESPASEPDPTRGVHRPTTVRGARSTNSAVWSQLATRTVFHTPPIVPRAPFGASPFEANCPVAEGCLYNSGANKRCDRVLKDLIR